MLETTTKYVRAELCGMEPSLFSISTLVECLIAMSLLTTFGSPGGDNWNATGLSEDRIRFELGPQAKQKTPIQLEYNGKTSNLESELLTLNCLCFKPRSLQQIRCQRDEIHISPHGFLCKTQKVLLTKASLHKAY